MPDPSNALARLYLANAQLRLGRNNEAARSYRSYLDAGTDNERSERVRRILRQIAPDLLPPEAERPLAPPARPARPPDEAPEAGS